MQESLNNQAKRSKFKEEDFDIFIKLKFIVIYLKFQKLYSKNLLFKLVINMIIKLLIKG